MTKGTNGVDHNRSALFRFGRSYGIARLATAGVAAIGSILSFSQAGADAVGLYAAIIATVIVGGGTAGGWFGQSILRFGSPTEPSRESLFRIRPLAVTALAFAISAFVSYTQVAGLNLVARGTMVMLTLVATAISMSTSIQIAKAQAQLRPIVAGVLEIGRAAAATLPPAISIQLVNRGPHPNMMMAVGVLILAAGLGFASLARGSKSERDTPQRAASFDDRWRYGWPLAAWVLISGFYQFSDRVLLTWMDTLETAGEYSLLYDVSNRGLVFPMVAIGTAVNPLVLRHYQKGDVDGARALNRYGMKIQIAMALLIGTLATAMIANFADRLPWFGASEFAVGVMLYSSGAVWVLATSIQRRQQGEASTRPLLAGLLISAVLNFILNLALIPALGGTGAALSTLLATILYLVWLVGIVYGNHDRTVPIDTVSVLPDGARPKHGSA